MAQHSFEHAAYCLRRAIPLMVEHKVPVTPINYALWYSYVAHDRPELETRLDAIVEKFGTCPESESELLFREHFTEYSGEELRQLRNEMDGLLSGVKGGVDRILGGARNFTEALKACSEDIHRLEGSAGIGVQELVGMVDRLAEETSAMRTTAGAVERQLAQAEAEIARLRAELARGGRESMVDPLTGLASRKAFDADLLQLAAAPKSASRLMLVMVSIDRFAQFNQRYGATLGETLLKHVAARMAAELGDDVRAYHFGAENFALLCIGGADHAHKVAERLRTAVERVIVRDNRSGEQVDSLSASFGLAGLRKGELVESLIERSGQALANARRVGENCVYQAD